MKIGVACLLCACSKRLFAERQRLWLSGFLWFHVQSIPVLDHGVQEYVQLIITGSWTFLWYKCNPTSVSPQVRSSARLDMTHNQERTHWWKEGLIGVLAINGVNYNLYGQPSVHAYSMQALTSHISHVYMYFWHVKLFNAVLSLTLKFVLTVPNLYVWSCRLGCWCTVWHNQCSCWTSVWYRQNKNASSAWFRVSKHDSFVCKNCTWSRRERII